MIGPKSVPAASAPAPGRRKWWLVLLLLLGLGLVAAAVYFKASGRFHDVSTSALAWLERLLADLGPWAPVVFVLLYIAACVALMPASFLTIGAGAVFGILWGSLYVYVGATLGAGAAFLVSRYLARDWVTRKFGHHPMFALIDNAVAEEGWKIIFLTRLAPVFPFFIMNYGYGLTRAPFLQYMGATFLGILPGSTLFVFIGYTLRQAASQDSTLTDWLKRGFILVTAGIALVYFGKMARRSLAKRTEGAGGSGNQ